MLNKYTGEINDRANLLNQFEPGELATVKAMLTLQCYYSKRSEKIQLSVRPK